MHYEGIHFDGESIETPPLPGESAHSLRITPRSFFFIEKNCLRLLRRPSCFKPLFPKPEFEPVEGIVARMEAYRADLQNILVSNGLLGWQVKFSQELREVFLEFERNFRLLPADRPHELRLLGIVLNKALIGPSTVHLDIHNGCNAKCVYCWFHSPTSDRRFDVEWKRQSMPPEIYYPLIDDLHRLRSKEDLLFSGKGEPLLHPQILDYLRYAREKDFCITLFTNGKKLSSQVNEFLIDQSIDRLYISLSAASRQIYPAINPAEGPEGFDRILNNLKDLSSQKKLRGHSNPQVYLVSVVTHLNVHEMVDFAVLASELEFEVVRFQLIHIQDYNQHLALSESDLKQASENLIAIEKQLKNTCTRVNENIHLQLKTVDPQTGNWFSNQLPSAGCTVGYDFSRVWADGKVSFCCSPKVLSSLKDQSFMDLWTSEFYQSLRTSALYLNEKTEKLFPDGTSLLGDHCFGCPNYEGVEFVSQTAKALFPESYVKGQ
jgi:MoaA/NifB/PqqE/SkfB family radical SAM enzyme